MEHEVFIPVPAETLREALRDHARVARCVPGLQQDADASARPLSGRLKVRVGGHTITYRGALTLTERAGAFTAKGEGAEVRGTGSTKVSVRIRLTETPGGTTVAFTTTSTPTSEGRLSDVAPSTAETTARRLLDRFSAALAKPGAGSSAGAGDGSGSTPAAGDADSPASGESTASAAEAGRDAPDAPGQGRDAPASDAGSAAGRDAVRADGRADDASGPHTGGPTPEFDGLELPDDPDSDPDLDASAGFGATASGDGDFLVPLEPPAEAAHARRTMIGRSAEEVDHAPPRGRYAPEQGPDSGGAGVALRWVAPAAALAIAGAVVVGRALRRRR
ncbi:SRPBCC domain-containing protein [Streptomyces niveus]|uniref:SRPBCC family protein n=1 Tax=Streptomyces niveus TaxID=193462 RepID=UPI002E2EDB18|nr:SRPBCC family protein [Streptomyces niveus]WTA60766.1 SRPBCC domain-containing protein [Streptomyces niveus]